MRKTITLKLTATLFLLLISSFCFAQNHVKVYGNVGVENVNISVLNTGYGTSSDKNGHYELILFSKSKSVDLLYTCIGYYDTLVSLSKEQLQQDSTRISFRMKSREYYLPDADVTASNDFYRSSYGSRIVDMAGVGNLLLVLEKSKKGSTLSALNKEGDVVGQSTFEKKYDEIHIDCFDNYILLNADSCLQIGFDENLHAMPVAKFSRQEFRKKLQNLLFEFNGAYIFRNTTRERNDFFCHEDHNQSQTYFYIIQDDTLHEKHFMFKFFDKEAWKTCQSYFSEIIAKYYQTVPETENVILQGMWDGNMLALADDYSLHRMIAWYCHIQATEYHTIALKFPETLQLIDLEKYKIVEFGEDFKVRSMRDLVITSGEKFFENQFVTDNVSGKTYGLFYKHGIHYVGWYNPQEGVVGMTTLASKKNFPDAFRISGGYAYSAYFDAEKQRGFVNRVKIE